MEQGQEQGVALSHQDNVQRVQPLAISALSVSTDILIIAANYGFALCLSAHDKWNKQVTFPFMSPQKAIRSNFQLPVI